MFGLSIIKRSELIRLREEATTFDRILYEASKENVFLREKITWLEKGIASLTPKRDAKGRFIKNPTTHV
jgi:hypothetical protein